MGPVHASSGEAAEVITGGPEGVAAARRPGKEFPLAEDALSDVVVLELATGVAGPYCGKLFADLGAQVIKVEPPGGDPMRAEPPLFGGESVFFNWLNANKLGVAASLSDERIDQLARHADVVIHSERGPGADALDARLAAANPRAVVLSLTPYGRSGERSGWQASAFTEWATGGYFYFAGDPSRAPLSLPGFQAEYHAGLHAAVAALAGLWHARTTGEGQRVEISHQEAVLNDHSWLTTMWTHQGLVQRRTGSAFAKCADGWVFLFNLVPYPNLFVLMERFDLLEDPGLQEPLQWGPRFPEVLAAFSEWAATRTKQEIYHAAQELRIAVSPVNDFKDVLESSQLAARQWFGEVEAGGERFKAPGVPYRLTATPCRSLRPAPAMGEHTGAVFSPSFEWANAPVPAPTQSPGSGREGPLSGLRLLEITANWAGPIAARHFGDLGADVIKIELQTKPATRALVFTGNDLWPDFFHRSAYFNKLNRNKRAIALDLSKPRGREIFLELVRRADIVVESNAARVMGQLGLGYDDLAEANPGIILCSISGSGATGPERDYSAYGSNIETLSGLASVLGYDRTQFFGTGTFYADPIAGNHGTVAILAALHARRRSGRGQWIDVALLEAVGPLFAQQFLEYTVTGELPVPQGDQWGNGWDFQAALATAGIDCWLALTCRTGTDDLHALCSVLGRPDLHELNQREELRAAVAAWCSGRDHLTAAAELQAAGIPAAPVMANWEIFTDNHLNDRGYFVPVRHPVAGTHAFPGFAWHFEKTPGTVTRPAPLFGQHNSEVFGDLLGLSDADLRDLYDSGVSGDHPVYGIALKL